MAAREVLERRAVSRSTALRRERFVVALFPIIGACIAGDDRCDTHQLVMANTCVCVPGAIPDPRGYGCTLCGANEEVQNSKCVCIAGYAKPTEGGMCEVAAIGESCAGDEDCPASFPFCATDGTDRYCSVQECGPTSCPSGYACEQGSGATYCGKLPAGLGDDCTSDADCTKEAKSCNPMSGKCVLTGCATKETACPGFYACCDLGMVIPGFSVCSAPETLMDGKCAFGNLVVP